MLGLLATPFINILKNAITKPKATEALTPTPVPTPTYNPQPYVNYTPASYPPTVPSGFIGPLQPGQTYAPPVSKQSTGVTLGANTNTSNVTGTASTPTANLVIPNTVAPATSGEAAGASVNEAEARRIAEQNEIDRLTPLYDATRRSITDQGGILDTSYQNQQKTIGDQLANTEETATRREGELAATFQDLLSKATDKYNTLRGGAVSTYNDLASRLQNTFSSLGTLDSSQFGEQQFRASQNVGNELTGIQKQLVGEEDSIEREKRTKISDLQDELKQYKTTAQSTLADLALQYQAGKQQIAQALVQNDLQGAAAIQQALDALTEKAQAIKSDIETKTTDFVNQAAILKAQGVDVNTNLGNISANDFAAKLKEAMQSATSGVYSRLAGLNVPGAGSTPAQNVQGFISPSGEKFNSYADYLKAILYGGSQ